MGEDAKDAKPADDAGKDAKPADDAGDGGASSPVDALREEFRELKQTLGALVGGRGVDDDGAGEGEDAGDKDKAKPGRTAAAQEADVETFVRGIVGKLHDEKEHEAEHARLASASAPKEEAPAIARRVTRVMWG